MALPDAAHLHHGPGLESLPPLGAASRLAQPEYPQGGAVKLRVARKVLDRWVWEVCIQLGPDPYRRSTRDRAEKREARWLGRRCTRRSRP